MADLSRLIVNATGATDVKFCVNPPDAIRRIESIAIGLAFGAVPVITCFLAGWWLSVPLVAESRIYLYALAGLALGVIVDVRFLRTWIRRAFSLKPWVWKAVYVFYSLGMFGFFMGVPIFHALLALPAGVFVGRWLVHEGADAARTLEQARRTAVFTTSILGLVCVASATVALASPSTPSDLKGMLGAPFQITMPMVLGIIIIGGAVLLALNWWVAVRSVALTYGYFASRVDSLRVAG